MIMFGHQTRGIIAVCIILAMIPLVLFLSALQTRPKAPMLSTFDPRKLVVEIVEPSGRSGIYFVGPEISMKQLFSQTGFITSLKDDLNVKNGMRIRLTPEGRIVTEKMESAKRLALGLPLDVNLADTHELALIPGVGDILAAKIVEHRQKAGPFKDIDQLKEMRGIKEKKLSRLRQYFYVEQSDL